MTFKSIGELAGTVLRNMKAARAIEVAQNLAASRSGEETDGSPVLISDAPPLSSSNGVAGKDGDPARPVVGANVKRTLPAAMRPVLRAVIGDKIETSIGMRGIRPRGFPASLPRSPMLVIVGGSDQWICPSCGISAAPMLSPTGLRLSRRMSQVLDMPAAAAPA